MSSAEKASIAAGYASEHGLLLSDCHAYGDSYADREMLRAVRGWLPEWRVDQSKAR